MHPMEPIKTSIIEKKITEKPEESAKKIKDFYDPKK